MGAYLDCGNESFRTILNSNYVDKTGLIEFVNSTLFTTDKLTCVSRPRRFGKSFAAKMLCAYYDKSCDSKELFDGLKIAKSKSYKTYLNQFDVIYLDITWFISISKDIGNVVNEIQASVIDELRQAFPGCVSTQEESLPKALLRVCQKTGSRFFIIIDEWDALFREAKNDEAVQNAYVQLLRSLFKAGPLTDSMIAGAYMTGILPIKKYGTESALTDFREYSMVRPLKLAEYVGFTEGEVRSLCEDNAMDFDTMSSWYDGYSFNRIKHVYSPNSVMSAIRNEEFGNYWTRTETYESLRSYISMNFDGLKDAIIAMLGDQRIKVNTLSFQNDMTSLKNRDNVLTLLIHLGYLAYDEANNEVYIPNLEVADSFKIAVQDTGWEEVDAALSESEALLSATIRGDGAFVAKVLSAVHDTTCSVLQYNNENSLSCALTIAYFTARRDYTIVRELPTGKGFADLAFIPKKHTSKPAMIVELKFDKSADTAIQQIKEKRYSGALCEYTGNLLLVGINYDRASKQHECMIESA